MINFVAVLRERTLNRPDLFKRKYNYMTANSSQTHRLHPKWDAEEKSVFDRGIFFSARQAIKHHASGGNILIIATVLALVIANIPSFNDYYFYQI